MDNDPITEAATEALPDTGIKFGPTGTTIIFSLAIYGATTLTMDVTRLTKKIYRNWKAEKVVEAEKAETPTDSPKE